jgi:HAD superfamily hydrolase (TIGR01456 family)
MWHRLPPAGRRLLFTDALGEGGLPPAFVFDIDGVLVRGGHVLPAAKRALAKLYTPCGSRPRYPVAFLTNSGGATEAAKAAQLSDWLGVAVGSDQVVLSHTPFRGLVARLGDEPVLASGRGAILEVAAGYGFRRAVSTLQLAAAQPSALPFLYPRHGLSAASTWHHPVPLPAEMADCGTEDQPFKAVLVFTDPSNWYLDLQLICDVILGGGVPGRAPGDVPEGTAPVEVVFSNPDLLWASDHPAPRLGQGGFAACMEALHIQVGVA